MATSPVSGSTSISQIAQPFGNTGSCISLLGTTASSCARSPARFMRAAAHPDHVGVAEDDVDPVDGHAEEIGHDLGKARLVSLTARLSSNDDVDTGVRADLDLRLLLGRADRGLHIVGKTETGQ